jgi:hypothetical protein
MFRILVVDDEPDLRYIMRKVLERGGHLAEMVVAARESERFPAYARSLTGLIRAAGATLLITSETTTLGPSPEPIGGVMFLFHHLEQRHRRPGLERAPRPGHRLVT